MKKLIAAGSGIIIIILIIYISGFSNNHVEAGNETEEYEYEYYYNDNETDSGDISVNETTNTSISDMTMSGADSSGPESSGTALPSDIDTDSDSITVFVNKEYSLPSTFIPKDLIIPDVKFYSDGPQEKRYLRDIAAKALEDMFSDASDDGEILYGVSGYRSYIRQNEIYNKNVRMRGIAATNQVSSVPGHSEHQTGLAIDISCKDLYGALSAQFADTTEGKWVADNCYRYGFIIRYPKDCELITGYTYEPWHIRYVGTDVATYIHDNNITFEEYFGYTPDEELINQITSDAATAEKVTQYDEPSATPEAKKDKSKKHPGKKGTDDSGKNVPATDRPSDNTITNAPAAEPSSDIPDTLPATAAPAAAAVPAYTATAQPAATPEPVITAAPTDIPMTATPQPDTAVPVQQQDVPVQQDAQ